MGDDKRSVITVKELFSPNDFNDICSFMANEFRFMPLGLDKIEFIRKYAHNNPFFVNIHYQLIDFASYHFGEKLKPSYVFLSIYQDGGTCPLHLDRPQCYRTIDYLISQDSAEPWPLKISQTLTDQEIATIAEAGLTKPVGPDIDKVITENEWEEVLLSPNDAVMYSGTNSWHYRPTKLSGSASLAFFHFVPEDFNGPLD